MKKVVSRPLCVSWRGRDQAHEVHLGHLHRLIAADPPLGLASWRGLTDWEHRRVCSERWVGAQTYKAEEWPKLGHMGHTAAEDEGISVAMVGGDWEGEEAVKEEPPPQGQTTTPQNP